MSNIYIQEPPTTGKVLLKTTVGEIEIELWSKEAVKTSRNFIQMCIDGFYNKTLFHRLVKGFIVQCGETDKIANVIEPIKNEFHSRLRFNRRGLVAMANTKDSDNNMQFFFTLGETPELQNTHTIFGKVTGDTIYNVLKLEESEVDHNERPLYPHKINKVVILNNPFPDIEKRQLNEAYDSYETKHDSKKKSKMEPVKNFKLLSFGDEAYEEEQDMESYTTKQKEVDRKKQKDNDSKAGSSGSEKLSKSKVKETQKKSSHDYEEEEREPETSKTMISDDSSDSELSDFESRLDKDKQKEVEEKKKRIQEEIRNVKKDYQKQKQDKNKEEEKETSKKPENEVIREYLDEKEKYKAKKPPKTTKASREQFTLALLEKFKSKLHALKDSSVEEPTAEEDLDGNNETWLKHKLDFTEAEDPILAKDASTKKDDWFDIYDPRNPINKRKRNETAATSDNISGNSSGSNKKRR